MYQYRDQKEMRRALNGKMIIMLVGIMLIMTALTSSLSYGMRCLSMAKMADAGEKEIVDALAEVGITATALRGCGAIYYVQAIVETLIGVFCFRLNNRLDKMNLLWKLAWGLFAVEILAGVALTALHMISPFMIISNVFLPIFLFWAIHGLKKIAKNYPDRMYAVEPNKNRNKQAKQAAKPAAKKSLMERATAQIPEEVKETVEIIEENNREDFSEEKDTEENNTEE